MGADFRSVIVGAGIGVEWVITSSELIVMGESEVAANTGTERLKAMQSANEKRDNFFHNNHSYINNHSIFQL